MVLSFEKFTLFMRLFLISEGFEESLAAVFCQKGQYAAHVTVTFLFLHHHFDVIFDLQDKSTITNLFIKKTKGNSLVSLWNLF